MRTSTNVCLVIGRSRSSEEGKLGEAMAGFARQMLRLADRGVGRDVAVAHYRSALRRTKAAVADSLTEWVDGAAKHAMARALDAVDGGTPLRWSLERQPAGASAG
jgi:hypothetical protein